MGLSLIAQFPRRVNLNNLFSRNRRNMVVGGIFADFQGSAIDVSGRLACDCEIYWSIGQSRWLGPMPTVHAVYHFASENRIRIFDPHCRHWIAPVVCIRTVAKCILPEWNRIYRNVSRAEGGGIAPTIQVLESVLYCALLRQQKTHRQLKITRFIYCESECVCVSVLRRSFGENIKYLSMALWDLRCCLPRASHVRVRVRSCVLLVARIRYE